MPDVKHLTTSLAHLSLRAFLRTGCVLDFTPPSDPRVSALLLLCNRAELTLACLHSLRASAGQVPLELVFVDNGSTDETALLLSRLRGVKVIRNPENRGYPRGVNQAAAIASGEYLLLLNNDTQVLGRSVDAAVEFLDAHPDVGAVGGRVILLDGTLQEAGCSILRDGWCRQQGRGESPDHEAYAFRRDVDYCSGAFLLTRRRAFRDLGGLDETFSPGYFEDADYAVRLWQAGWRVAYLPEVVILHHENATSSMLWNANDQCRRNHARFVAKHARWLRAQLPQAGCSPLQTRFSHDVFFKVFLVADGFGTAARAVVPGLIRRFQSLDAAVTLCQTRRSGLGPLAGRSDGAVEVVTLESLEQVGAFLQSRPACHDLVILGQPPLVAPLARLASSLPACAIQDDTGRVVLVGPQMVARLDC